WGTRARAPRAFIVERKRMLRPSHLILGMLAVGICAGAVMAADDATDPLQHTRRMLEQHPDASYDPEAILVRFAPTTSDVQKNAIRAIVGGVKLQEWTIVPNLEQVKV